MLIDRRFEALTQITEGYALILRGLGLSLDTPHLEHTPGRAAAAMYDEICKGLHTPSPKMTTFPLEGTPSMVVSLDIPVRSICAHHLLPFVGTAAVAYIPKDKLLGLSKLSRAVEWVARKPQVQEELTSGVADFLVKTLFDTETKGPEWNKTVGYGVGVVVRAKHFCMELRGVGHQSDVVTSALRGSFLHDEAVRSEFLALANSHKK